jgi:hypothetical protein
VIQNKSFSGFATLLHTHPDSEHFIFIPFEPNIVFESTVVVPWRSWQFVRIKS